MQDAGEPSGSVIDASRLRTEDDGWSAASGAEPDELGQPQLPRAAAPASRQAPDVVAAVAVTDEPAADEPAAAVTDEPVGDESRVDTEAVREGQGDSRGAEATDHADAGLDGAPDIGTPDVDESEDPEDDRPVDESDINAETEEPGPATETSSEVHVTDADQEDPHRDQPGEIDAAEIDTGEPEAAEATEDCPTTAVAEVTPVWPESVEANSDEVIDASPPNDDVSADEHADEDAAVTALADADPVQPVDDDEDSVRSVTADAPDAAGAMDAPGGAADVVADAAPPDAAPAVDVAAVDVAAVETDDPAAPDETGIDVLLDGPEADTEGAVDEGAVDEVTLDDAVIGEVVDGAAVDGTAVDEGTELAPADEGAADEVTLDDAVIDEVVDGTAVDGTAVDDTDDLETTITIELDAFWAGYWTETEEAASVLAVGQGEDDRTAGADPLPLDEHVDQPRDPEIAGADPAPRFDDDIAELVDPELIDTEDVDPAASGLESDPAPVAVVAEIRDSPADGLIGLDELADSGSAPDEFVVAAHDDPTELDQGLMPAVLDSIGADDAVGALVTEDGLAAVVPAWQEAAAADYAWPAPESETDEPPELDAEPELDWSVDWPVTPVAEPAEESVEEAESVAGPVEDVDEPPAPVDEPDEPPAAGSFKAPHLFRPQDPPTVRALRPLSPPGTSPGSSQPASPTPAPEPATDAETTRFLPRIPSSPPVIPAARTPQSAPTVAPGVPPRRRIEFPPRPSEPLAATQLIPAIQPSGVSTAASRTDVPDADEVETEHAADIPQPRRWHVRRVPLMIGALVVVVVVGGGVLVAMPNLARTFGITLTADRATGAPPAPVRLSPLLRPPATDASMPTSAGVSAALGGQAGNPALAELSGIVLDANTNSVLWDHNSAGALTPASTNKLLTSAAALLSLNQQATLDTTVVAGSQPGTVVLIGGGDPTLSSLPAPKESVYPGAARLADLAAQVKAHMRGPIRRVLVDTGRYSGGETAPCWDPADVSGGNFAPIVAAMMDGGRVDPTDPDSPRTRTPARDVGVELAKLLNVDPSAVTLAPAPAGAEVLGTVHSAPVSDLVANLLRISDNVLAEALGREVARADHKPPTFAGASEAVLDVLARNGFDISGAHLVDSSGLSTQDKVPAKLLAGVLRVAAAADGNDALTAKLRPLLDGLPVAGGTGTLSDRYETTLAAAGKGWVRAKTGTLSSLGVNTLAGVVLDVDGRVLVFALMSNGSPPGSYAQVQAALDAMSATLRGCGCR